MKGSGIQESLDAINVQSEYESLNGLIRMYLDIKLIYETEKKRLKEQKDKKTEILEQSAQKLLIESNNRRCSRSVHEDDDENTDPMETPVKNLNSELSSSSSSKKRARKLTVFEENYKKLEDSLNSTRQYKQHKIQLSRDMLMLEERRLNMQQESESRTIVAGGNAIC